jgi:hypothetical protein
LTAEKGNLFQIPPYFAYIAKSFSVLEGIGLSNDPNYSIINECLPYVSQRLLTDKDNLGPALSTFMFGPQKKNADRLVDYKRVEQLVEGFGSYTSSALGVVDASRAQMLETASETILNLVLTEEETPLQAILLEQLAKMIASSSRYVLTNLRERSGVLPSGRTVLGTVFDPLGLWRTSPLVRMNALDETTVETSQKLIALLQRQLQASESAALPTNFSREETVQLAQVVTRKMWDRRMGIFQTGSRLARQLVQLTANQLDSGERDTRVLPARAKLEPKAAFEKPLLVSDAYPQRERPILRDSARLEKARNLLDELQSDSLG